MKPSSSAPSTTLPPVRPALGWIRSGLATLAVGLNLVAGLGLLQPSVVHADEDKAPPSGRSTGSRGCGTFDSAANLDAVDAVASIASADPSLSRLGRSVASTLAVPAVEAVPSLILLAPSQQLGHTASQRPTFAWFVRSKESMPLEFRLYEKVASGYALVKEIKGSSFRSTPGIMVLSPLNGLPELTPGKQYRWQVEMVCDAFRPSGNVFAEAEVAVVPLQAAVKQQLATVDVQSQQLADRHLDHAQIYVQANLWYDALGHTLLALKAPNGKASSALREFQRSLLDRIAINDVERQMLRQSPVSEIQPLISARD
jgi:hypothetical protein